MNTTTDTFRRFAWEGPLGLEWIIPIACILFFLIHWTLRRERSALGERYYRLFWILRTASLLVMLWMLLAPSSVVTERTTIKQTLVIATDVSPSMGIVDDPQTADDVRWTIASSDAIDGDAIQAADRAVVSSRIAVQHLNSAERLASQQASTDVILKDVAVGMKAMDRAKQHLQVVAAKSETPEKARAILRLLDDEAFHQLKTQTQSDRKASSFAWQGQLSDANHNAAAIQRRLVYLADQIREDHGTRIRSLNAKELNQVRTQPRLERVASALEHLSVDRAEQEEQNAVIRYCSFDSAASALADQSSLSKQLVSYIKPDEFGNRITDLNASLSDIKRQHDDGRLAAVILYSDALHTADTPQLPRVKFKDTPVYVVPIGNPKHVRDVAIQAVLAPRVVMQNDNVVIEVDLQTYDCNGESCTVELLSDQKMLAHQTLKITNDASIRRVRFDTQIGDLGQHLFTVRIVPMDNELTEENNSESFDVNVTRSKIGVLLSDEVPRWEFRYLAQLFRRDAKIEADELLFQPRVVATGAREADKAFPTTVDEWAMYDVVILGDVETKHLSPESQESLTTYLRERGGSLVLIAGSESMPAAYANQPLEAILPVQRTNRRASRHGYSLQVTDGGTRHHALMIAEDSISTQMAWEFVNRNAPAGWLSPFRKPRATARTLIQAVPRHLAAEDPEAFLCWQPVGRGRVIYFSGPETYRLRYLRGDKYHFRLWGQLLRWAIASDLSESNRLVRLRSDKNRYDENEDIMLSVQLVDQDNHPVREAEISAIAARENEPPITVQLTADEAIPGRYNGRLGGLSPGQYDWHVQGVEELLGNDLAPPEGHFLVRPFVSKELMDTRCNLVLAQKIADATGGQVLPPTAVAEVLELTDLNPIVTETTKSTPLWIRWELMFLVVGCLSSEWVIRKWKGYS